jgi:hypothetical protein
VGLHFKGPDVFVVANGTHPLGSTCCLAAAVGAIDEGAQSCSLWMLVGGCGSQGDDLSSGCRAVANNYPRGAMGFFMAPCDVLNLLLIGRTRSF